LHSALSCIIFIVTNVSTNVSLLYYYYYYNDIALDYNIIIIIIYKVFTVFVLHITEVWLKLCRSIIISTTYYGLQPKYKLLVDILTVIWHFKSTIDILFHSGGSRLHKKLIILKLRSFYFTFTLVHCRPNRYYSWLRTTRFTYGQHGWNYTSRAMQK